MGGTRGIPAAQSFRVTVAGVGFDPLCEREVVDHVFRELATGRGGHIVTPNVDILRRVLRDPASRQHVGTAQLVVADGAPLVWASRLKRTPLPARVAGSDLIWSLSAAAARHGRSTYLLGGAPGTAQRAQDVLRDRFPTLTLAGHLSPPFGFEDRPQRYAALCDEVAAAQPDLVFVGLGFPRQERVIARLRDRLPRTWFLGCGAAIGFVAGVHQRAPLWMQEAGLEWFHRLTAEPGRLGRRYLLHDVPFAARLLAGSALHRLRLRRGTDAPPTQPDTALVPGRREAG